MKTIPVKYAASVSMSNVDKKSDDSEQSVRLCNYTDVYYNERITSAIDFMEATASDEQIRRFALRRGDVLLTKDSETADDIAVPAYVAEDLPQVLCGYHLAHLRPSPGVDGRFLFWALAGQSTRDQFSLSANGITRFGLRQDSFGEVRLPLPPLGAQRAIADLLDTETARIDALIEKTQRMEALLKERGDCRQADLAVGAAMSSFKSSGHDWLGEIPDDWSVVRLKYYAKLESGHTPSRTRPELWENAHIPWVTLNDVGFLEDHEYIDQTVNLISAEGLANSSARLLPAGTVILSRDATIGRAGILARPMATSQHFADWVCSEELRPRYLWLLFKTVVQRHLQSLTDGATLRTIGMPDIKEIVIPLPPPDTQDAIVNEAAVIRDEIAQTLEHLQTRIGLLTERRQAIITAAVAGELEIGGIAA